MTYDGIDILYLLKKRGISMTDVAQQLKCSTPHIFCVINGRYRSPVVIRHIEKLLDMRPGTLRISPKTESSLVKVA